MNQTPKILAFAGSARRESFNKKLVQIAAEGAKKAQVQVTTIDLANFPMSLYNEDEETQHGLPPEAIRLRELFLQHQGLLISSPEYNSSITPLLKNTIDWISRPWNGQKSLYALEGKIVALVSASPGYYGGMRGLMQLRLTLGQIGIVVLPQQFSLSKAHEAFDEKGALKNPEQQKSAENIGKILAEYLLKKGMGPTA